MKKAHRRWHRGIWIVAAPVLVLVTLYTALGFLSEQPSPDTQQDSNSVLQKLTASGQPVDNRLP